MNDTSNATPNASHPLRNTLKVSFPMKRELHDEIQNTLAEISTELGFEVTMPKFLNKTVTESWKLQAERFRKLNTTLKR